MDNNIGRALWIGIGILFFIAVVSLGLSMLDQGRSIAQEQSEKLSDIQKRLSDAEFDIYDNQSVSGAQVVAAIKSFREFKDVFSIRVTTNKGTVTYLNGASFSGTTVTLGSAHDDGTVEDAIKSARDEANAAFINPVASFDSQVRKDSNGVISAIEFVQE